MNEGDARGASWVLQFDGGAAQREGTGGVLIWDDGAHVVTA